MTILTIIFAIFAFSVSAEAAEEWQLPALMQLLAQNKANRATFVEKKYIGILERPVESSGELAFEAPDKLVKRTLKPKFESLVLEGDKLIIDQPGKQKFAVSLTEHPEVSAFIESIRGTLAGDRHALEKFYTLDLSGSSQAWHLVLVPKEPRMASIISRIKISGSHDHIGNIHFDQGDGDSSEMIITKVITQ